MGAALSSHPVHSWSDTCARLINDTFVQNCTLVGLTRGDASLWTPPSPCPGVFPNVTATDIWGISHETCNRFCGPSQFYQTFIFADFATASANWLLPWLALIAQLPYEAEGTRDNLMSAFIAVGSPPLLAYSFAITALNRWQIRSKFGNLITSKAKRIKQTFPHFEDRLEAACMLLQEAQQCPIRLSNAQGWLSSLILLPQNSRFWATTVKYLRTTRRRRTPSLIAQLSLAVITYFFTFFSALSVPGSTVVGLQFALSSGFTWMFALIIGVVFVSSQLKIHAVKNALDEPEVSDGGYNTFRSISATQVIQGRQKGIKSRTGLNHLVKWREASATPTVNANGNASAPNGNAPNGTNAPPHPADPNTDLEATYPPSSPSLSPQTSGVPLLAVQSPTRNNTREFIHEGGANATSTSQSGLDGLAPRLHMLRRTLTDSPPHLAQDPTGNTVPETSGPSTAFSLGPPAGGALLPSSRSQRSRTSSDRFLDDRQPDEEPDPFDYYAAPPVPPFYFWRLEGDERKEGPLYNYARVFTSFQALRQLHHGFASTLSKLNLELYGGQDGAQPATTNISPGCQHHRSNSLLNASSALPAMLLQGDTRRMATTTDLVPNPKGETPMMMAAYVGWRQTEPDLWLHLIIAHLFGYIILWSGVGAGIYVSYETPFKGLGCRSGALLLFGVLATVSFWLLAISSYFSHHVMLCYQRIFRMNAAVIADRTKHHFKGFDTGRYLTMLKVVTVMTRLAGKSLAFINAIWLITACIMQLSGFFSQCWCQSNALSFGSKGMVVLWRTDAQLAEMARRVWIGGFVWSIVTPIVAGAWLWALARKSERNLED